MRQMHPLTKLYAQATSRLAATLLLTLAGIALALPFAHAEQATPAAAATRTTLAAAPVQTAAGTGETLSATVRTTTGSAVAGGSVDFVLANGQSVGSALVGADGMATLVLSQLPPAATKGIAGNSQLGMQAVYSPGAAAGSYLTSASPAAAIAARDTTAAATTQLPDFTVTGTPTTVTVAQGSYGTASITVTSLGGYTGSVEFSCSGLPRQTACVFNPTQQTLTANGTFVTTLQLETQAPSGTASSALARHDTLALALIVPGSLVLFGLAGRRRKSLRGLQMLGLQILGSVLLLAGGTLGLSGCSQRYGYLNHPPTVSPGTPTGTYPITVAVDGSQGSAFLEHLLTVTLVVN